MKICLAQTNSTKGDLPKNIQNHLRFIHQAVEWEADLIVFPELSLTGYEPTLASALAREVDDPIFNPFQKIADKKNITIAAGMPIKNAEDFVIGMMIFQPNTPRSIYAKQILHEDELPFFVAGEKQIYLNIEDQKIAPAICYEALQEAHFLKSKKAGATIYMASVAKSEQGIIKAYSHFAKISAEFSTPIFLVNAVGHSDDFLACGKTLIWNAEGKIMGQLGDHRQGILSIDLDSGIIKKIYFEGSKEKITLAQSSDLSALVTIFQAAKKYLDQQNIFQWTDHYPSPSIIKKDLENGQLYLLKKDQKVIGAVTLNEYQDVEYQSIDWKFKSDKILVIHRLVVHPTLQRHGYAKQLMDFAETFAKENNYDAIRLDTYTQNKISCEFYRKRNYVLRGTVFFPGRPDPFYCMEKRIKMDVFEKH